MFYFIINIIVYLILIIVLYHYYSKKRVTILNFLIILFLLNTYFILLYKEVNVIIGLIITFLILIIERLYNYLYLIKEKDILNDKILIKYGNINFKGLVDSKYPYQKLITNLKRKGINNISEIDYCVLYHNELVVFRGNIKNYPVSLIIDGKIISDNLISIKKNKEWLEESLNQNHLILKEISYAFYKDQKLYFLTDL